MFIYCRWGICSQMLINTLFKMANGFTYITSTTACTWEVVNNMWDEGFVNRVLWWEIFSNFGSFKMNLTSISSLQYFLTILRIFLLAKDENAPMNGSLKNLFSLVLSEGFVLGAELIAVIGSLYELITFLISVWGNRLRCNTLEIKLKSVSREISLLLIL